MIVEFLRSLSILCILPLTKLLLNEKAAEDMTNN